MHTSKHRPTFSRAWTLWRTERLGIVGHWDGCADMVSGAEKVAEFLSGRTGVDGSAFAYQVGNSYWRK